jgi:hypothetical protein
MANGKRKLRNCTQVKIVVVKSTHDGESVHEPCLVVVVVVLHLCLRFRKKRKRLTDADADDLTEKPSQTAAAAPERLL